MEQATPEVTEEPQIAKPWGVWPSRQTRVDNEALKPTGKKRSGITTTPRPKRHDKARLKAKAAAKARKRNRG